MKTFSYIIYDNHLDLFSSFIFHMKKINELPPKNGLFNSSYDDDKKITTTINYFNTGKIIKINNKYKNHNLIKTQTTHYGNFIIYNKYVEKNGLREGMAIHKLLRLRNPNI